MPDTFTPEQIAQILEEFFKVVGTRQYIGARYVPIFGRKGEESIEWDNTAPYEPLTIVLYQGNSYTSRQYVPVGVEITNQEFWALTGNYNAQVEQYRREVAAFDARITANADAIDAEARTRADAIDAEARTRADADDALSDEIAGVAQTAQGIAEDVTNIEAKIDLADKKVVFYGDSTVAGGSPSYPIVFANISGAQVTNRAVSGTSVSVGSNSFETLINQASDLNTFDVLFFSYGINDWQNSVAIGRVGYGNRFGEKLNEVIKTIQTEAPNLTIIGITSNYCHRIWANNSNGYNRNRHGFTLENYVNEFIRVCRKMSVPVLDLYHTLGINETNYQQCIDVSEGDIWVHPNQTYKNKTAQLLYKNFYSFYTQPQNNDSKNVVNILGIYGNNNKIDLTDSDIAAAYNAVSANVNSPYILMKPNESYIVNFPKMNCTPTQPLYFSGHVGKADYGTGTSVEINCNNVITLLSTAGDFVVPITYETPTNVSNITIKNTSSDIVIVGAICVSFNPNKKANGNYVTNLTQYIDSNLFAAGSYAYVIFDNNDGAKVMYHLVLANAYTANTQLKIFSTNLWQLFDGIMHLTPCVWNESGVYQSFAGICYTNRNYGNAFIRDNHAYGAGATIDGEFSLFPLNRYVAFS